MLTLLTLCLFLRTKTHLLGTVSALKVHCSSHQSMKSTRKLKKNRSEQTQLMLSFRSCMPVLRKAISQTLFILLLVANYIYPTFIAFASFISIRLAINDWGTRKKSFTYKLTLFELRLSASLPPSREDTDLNCSSFFPLSFLNLACSSSWEFIKKHFFIQL